MEFDPNTQFKDFRSQFVQKIADTLRENPSLSYPEAAKMFGISRSWITNIAKAAGIRRPLGRKPSQNTHATLDGVL
jgi:DNA invertase Pin-like site-specific DNA recombinase